MEKASVCLRFGPPLVVTYFATDFEDDVYTAGCCGFLLLFIGLISV
jgi:hypothetical protein